MCGVQSNKNDVMHNKQEFHLVHQTIHIQEKNKRKKINIACEDCGITVDDKKKLTRHKESQHPVSSSSEPSPPRKKQVKKTEVTIVEAEVEMKDIPAMETKQGNKSIDDEIKMDDTNSVDSKDEIIKTQAEQIKKQEKFIENLKGDVQKN